LAVYSANRMPAIPKINQPLQLARKARLNIS
jgi:hypothetical protein